MKIPASELWMHRGRVLLDVRTPAEFARGHIPGALNLPLFSDDERAEVGTLYKQTSPEAALLRGLELVGPKMRALVEQARRLAPQGNVLLHCWRGGKRSESMAWLLRLAGFDALTLEGGYKAYRRHVLESFERRRLKIIVLGGKTGCTKTALLHRLRQLGEQVLDLEGLAHHKGSAFGALGQPAQPMPEQFENDLFEEFRRLDPTRPVWVENENRAIGRVFIPEAFWRQMKAAPLINIALPLERRIQNILADYGAFPREELAEAFRKIHKRLGGQNLLAALQALEAGDLRRAVEIALTYYDKAYQHYLDKNQAPHILRLEFQDEPLDAIAEALRRCARENAGAFFPEPLESQTFPR
ncbi:MAG: tRNA 2-selenouridine(34) synthase MnmH [Bacteroidetes bacterium]|nr:MAG: tRNA 2-selenouridine(34) synthase MnmH [Bacteroidota bacterium]